MARHGYTGFSADFDVRRYRRPGLTDEKLEELKESFDLIDMDGAGVLHPKELKATMQSLGFDAKNQTVYQLMSAIDSDGSGSIEFEEFIELMIAPVGEGDTRENTDKVFRLLDDDKTGTLTIKNLRRVARELGETIPDDELMEMIERADTNGDGQVTPQDFYDIMTKTKFF